MAQAPTFHSDPAGFELHPATASDTAAILALNTACEALTSPMDGARLERLTALSALLVVARYAGGVGGFLMAFEAGSAYDSANYRWFDSRLQRFLYVDRIVVDAPARGTGLAQRLYAHAFEHATSKDLAWVAAEMNLVPANERSLRFHAARGFMEVGRTATDGGKILSMQICPLTA